MATTMMKHINMPNDPLPADATADQKAAWTPRVDMIVPMTADEIAAQQSADAQFLSDKAAIDASMYLRDRKSEYPKVIDLLLLLWADMDNGSIAQAKTFYAAIKAVNDKYPAPV